MADATDWERTAFQSSNIHSGRYSPSTRTMILQYSNGDEYSHSVGPGVWKELKDSPKPGRMVHTHIKVNFPGTKLRKGQ